jgi:hypothetical protein
MVKTPFRLQLKAMVNPTNFRDQVLFHKLFSPLKQLEVQRVPTERITPVLRLGDVWVPIDSSVKH